MIGIKDFEMPHDCDSCPFFMGENTHCTVGCFVPYGYDDHGENRPKDCPLIEVALKDQCEARLKADMTAVLEELKKEIEENGIVDFEETYVDNGECIISVSECNRFIQEKINALKENKGNE